MAVTLSSHSACACLLRSPRTSVSRFLPQSFKLGSNPLLPRTTLPPRMLVVRAARTESRGVSLGFRPPSFEVSIVSLFMYSFFKNDFCLTWIFVGHRFQSHLLGKFGNWRTLNPILLYWSVQFIYYSIGYISDVGIGILFETKAANP